MSALIEKYLQGKCSPEEQQQLEKTLKQYGYSIDEDDIREVFRQRTGSIFPDQQASERMEAHIKQKISRPVRRIGRSWWMGIAATFIITLFSVAFYFRYTAPPGALKDRQWTTETNAGQGIKKLLMPDSSEIWLNASSSIQYAGDYNSVKREVRLKGEAFFKVKHHTHKPFIVTHGRIRVLVMGTSFNVNTYEEEPAITVSVATGKVNVSVSGNQTSSVFLLPGDHYSYNRRTGTIANTHKDLVVLQSWTDGYLEFTNETLEAVARVIGRSYGVTFEFRDKALMKKRVTLKQRNETLKTIMEVIKITSGIQYRINGKQVLITN